jgi:hypothetical protein
MGRANRQEGGISIGQQQAGQVTNVGRDQVVHGGIHGSQSASTQQQLADVELLKQLLDDVALTAADRRSAQEAATELEAELANDDPDPDAAARPLERLTSVLKNAGALAGAGVALIDPIGRIAIALGTAGMHVLRLIGR